MSQYAQMGTMNIARRWGRGYVPLLLHWTKIKNISLEGLSHETLLLIQKFADSYFGTF